jgi:hypothetical protein
MFSSCLLKNGKKIYFFFKLSKLSWLFDLATFQLDCHFGGQICKKPVRSLNYCQNTISSHPFALKPNLRPLLILNLFSFDSTIQKDRDEKETPFALRTEIKIHNRVRRYVNFCKTIDRCIACVENMTRHNIIW